MQWGARHAVGRGRPAASQHDIGLAHGVGRAATGFGTDDELVAPGLHVHRTPHGATMAPSGRGLPVAVRAASPGRADRPGAPERGAAYRTWPMDRTTLRAVQRPLKERYRDMPDAAVVTLRAVGDLAAGDVACSVETGRALVTAGLHPATGGDGTLSCSGDMLLQALVACAGVTLRSVATNRGLDVHGTVHAEGDLDFRGTLGVDPDAPVGFRAIRLSFALESSATDAELAALVATTEKYCVVLQTLVGPPVVSVERR
jgi:uncharacterized OsmC-like protein